MNKRKHEIGVGIIGMGKRGGSVALNMAKTYHRFGLKVIGIYSRSPEKVSEAARLVTSAYREVNIDTHISCHSSIDSMLEDPHIDLILITSPQYAHAQATIPALKSGKKIFLDKPIAHDLSDSLAIAEVEKQTGNTMLMGFTRRYEAPWLKAFEMLCNGVIGKLHLIQIRSIVPYDIYFHGWHRQRSQSGDALNDKSSHHFDVFNWFSQSQATRISGVGGRSVYVEDPLAPKRCPECEKICPYRAHRSSLNNPDDMHNIVTNDSKIDLERADDRCVFAPGADILDHALIQTQYANGVLASLVYCIFGPKANDQETLELVGSSGRMVLTRHTGQIELFSNYGKNHEIITSDNPEIGSGHFGADYNLLEKMREFVNGASPVVSGSDGLAATRMAMGALQSVNEKGKQFDL